jgi:hypothetical protein
MARSGTASSRPALTAAIAWGCRIYRPRLEVVRLWETGPGLDPGPIQSRYRGLGAVPVWFVRTEDYLAATADGVLTIGELEALDPLMGAGNQ